MKTLLRSLLVLLAVWVLAVVVSALVATQAGPWHGTVSIDEGAIAIRGLDDLGGSHAALGIALGTVAVAGALLVAVAAVVVGLAAAVVGVVTAVLAVAGSLLLVASPLIVIGWLVWRVVRQRPPGPRAATTLEARA